MSTEEDLPRDVARAADDTSHPTKPHARPVQRLTAMSRVTAYWTAFFIACTSSGGIILGLSAFADHAIKLGLLNASDSEVVFTVGFQMLTWLSLFWSSQQDALGPRACADPYFGDVSRRSRKSTGCSAGVQPRQILAEVTYDDCTVHSTHQERTV